MSPPLGHASVVGEKKFIQKSNSTSTIEPEVKKHEYEVDSKITGTRKEFTNKTYEIEIVWLRVVAIGLLHVGAFYGLYTVFARKSWFLTLYGFMLAVWSGLGIAGGAHRLWCHRAYKAKLPMRIMLMLFQTLAHQNSIYEWVRDHRVHHKFTDTDADPHNSRRGFFFSHVGWLMIKKHPDVKLKGKTIDMSDLEADPVVMFQKKYFLIMMPFISFILPALIPHLLWGYPFLDCFFNCCLLRYAVSLHATWSINSAAHLWGYRPYDNNINPCDNRFVMAVALGEGYHNYHHIFPWDYKTAEYGSYFFNFTKIFIDWCTSIGWAYDLKTVSEDMIRKRVLRTGDGTHPISTEGKKTEELIAQLDHEKEDQMIWGWDDKDMLEEDRKCVYIINKHDD